MRPGEGANVRGFSAFTRHSMAWPSNVTSFCVIASALPAVKRPAIAVTLCALNALIFGTLCFRWSAPRLPAVLGGISIALGCVIMPDAWITPVIANYSKGAVIFALVNTALVLVAIKKRTAKWSIVGGLCVASLILAIGQKLHFEQHLAIQAACSFFFITSLFWKGPEENGHLVAAIALGALWTIDTWTWQADGFLRFVPAILAAPLLVLSYCLRRAWLHIAIAAIIILALPFAAAGPILQKTPPSILAVGASFALFGLGTAFAIWKRKLSDDSKGIEGMSR